MNITANSIDGETLLDISANGLTSGKGINLASTSNALTSGNLISLDWSPTISTTASGDLFSINIGSLGTTTGNLFNIKDASSSIFSISETALTSNLPASFNSPGDVSMAYDLIFTNQTTANILSNGPLYITAGQSFENNDLTLITYGTGDLVLDTPGGVTLIQAQNWNIADSSPTSLNIESGLLNLDSQNTRVGIGTTAPDSRLHVRGGDLYVAPDTGYTFNNPTANEDLYVFGNIELDGILYGTGVTLSGGINATGNIDTQGTLQAGSSNITLTLATGYIDAAALTLTTSGGAGSTLSNSGLEVVSNGLTLLKGCTDGQILKWDNTNEFWYCAADNNSGGATAWDDIGDPDGNNTINLSTFTTQFDFTGTTTTGWTYNADSLTEGTAYLLSVDGITSGKGLDISSTSGAFTGALQSITLSGSNVNNTGTLLDISNTGGSNNNTSLYIKHYADGTGPGNFALRVDDQASDTSPFVIDELGNVGIGTTNPGLNNSALAITKSYTNQGAFVVDNDPTFAINSNGSYSIIGYDLDLTTSGSGNNTASEYLYYGALNNNNTGTLTTGYGTFSEIYNKSTGTITQAAGGYFDVQNQGGDPGGNITTAYGVYSTVKEDSAATISTAYGVYSNVTNTGTTGGTIQNAYGLYSGILNSSGTVGTGYGLYIDDLQATLDFGIFQTDSGAENYFAGNVGIGTTAPDALLHVRGGDLYVAPDTGYTFNNPTANEDLYVFGNAEIDGILYAGSTPVALTLATGFIDSDAITLTTTGGTGATLSNSGLQVVSDGLTLLKGCNNAQILKWDNTGEFWYCAADESGGGGAFTSASDIIDKTTAADRLRLAYGDAGDVQLEITNVSAAVAPTADVVQLNLTGGDGITADNIDGLYINIEGADGTSTDVSALHLDFDPIGGSADDTFSAVLIDSLTATAASEYGINMNASGWDIGLRVTTTITGTAAQDIQNITITNQTSSGTQRGIVITNANDAANATTESLILLDNAEDATSTLTDAILITSSGVSGGIVDGLDVSDSFITNAINIGDNIISGTNFTVATTGGITSAGDWIWSATTPTITINAAETVTIGPSGGDTFTINASGSLFSFSDGTNSFTFDVDSGPLYAGTARPTRKVTLSPEFPGATLTGDTTNNVGTMTSDFCENGVSADIPQTNTAVCNTSGDIHNYYSWVGQGGSANDYDIWVRWRVPDNFAAFAASGNPIQVWGKRTDATNNAVTVFLYDTAGTLENGASGTQVAGTAWTQTSIEAAPYEGTYTAGSYATFRIVMTADISGDTVQVGEIDIEYLTNN